VEALSAASRLTAREREVARLVGLGFTNRQIANQLFISQRTVDTHVQNILNKLGATNRAQIASWSARVESDVGARVLTSEPTPAAEPRVAASLRHIEARPRRRRLWLLSAVVVGSLLLVTIAALNLTGGATTPSVTRGPLAYEASLLGDGYGFSSRYVIGDSNASAIRFTKGATDYVVMKPGGNTGNSLGLAPMKAYLVDVQLSVEPGSDVEFWIDLTGPYTNPVGKHLIGISTQVSEMQLAYFDRNFAEPLGGPVPIEGLQNGRTFTVSALVNPPSYTVYLDGTSRIALLHEPNVEYQAPAFSVFGQGGTVHLTGLRVYRLTSS
jgi:DNA-binding CsgD family transcriptional regulator